MSDKLMTMRPSSGGYSLNLEYEIDNKHYIAHTRIQAHIYCICIGTGLRVKVQSSTRETLPPE
jgi:hypothetical protein